jgi:arylsulfatase A-like enzyme
MVGPMKRLRSFRGAFAVAAAGAALALALVAVACTEPSAAQAAAPQAAQADRPAAAQTAEAAHAAATPAGPAPGAGAPASATAAPQAGAGVASQELAPPFAAWEGFACTAALPAEWPSDTVDRQDSQLVLLEDGRPLGPPHAPHADIRARGAGAYSHWKGTLIFSSSDGSDPSTNGRRYVAEYRGPTGLGRGRYAPLALRDPFASLPAGSTALTAQLAQLAPLAPVAPVAPVAPSARSASGAATAPRVVWWYVIDALRADVPFTERDGARVMPELARFAEAEAVRFEHAYATSSFTKTSTASMFTGLWPTHHRVLHGLLPVWPTGVELVFDLDPRFVTLAGALSAAGWDTWTHPYSLHVRPGDGMLAGFRHLDLDVQGERPMPPPPPDARLFAYEHVLGVHGPYAPSAAARQRLALPAPAHVDPAGTAWFEEPLGADALRELHEAYLGEAADADARFAQRVAWLVAEGLWDDTLLVVTADHGEGFLEHGLTQHSNSLYEEAVRVPLLVHFPAGSPLAAHHGRSVPHRVSLADLYPTLLELTGVPQPPYALDGASLLPILDGRESDPRARDVVLRCSFTRGIEGGRGDALFVTDAILSGTRKAQFGFRIQSAQDAEHDFRQGDWVAELFDLADDPGEARNLAAGQPGEFLALMERHAAAGAPLLARDDAMTGDAATGVPAPPIVDPADAERLEQLRALGYVR